MPWSKFQEKNDNVVISWASLVESKCSFLKGCETWLKKDLNNKIIEYKIEC